MSRRTRTVTSWSFVLAVFVTVGLLAVALDSGLPRAAAQSSVSATSLIRQDVSALPAAPSSIALSRVTLIAGASVTVHPASALTGIAVESGSVTVASGGTGQTGTSATPGAGTTVRSGADIVLATDAAANVGVRNAGQDTASLLVAQVAAQGAVPSSASGVSVQPLVVGTATAMPRTPARFTLNRVTYPAGADVAAYAHSGPTLVSVESGALGLPTQGGQIDVTHATASGTPAAGSAAPVMATPGTTATLQAGDSAFIHDGTVSGAQNPGSSTTTILVLALTPISGTSTATSGGTSSSGTAAPVAGTAPASTVPAGTAPPSGTAPAGSSATATP